MNEQKLNICKQCANHRHYIDAYIDVYSCKLPPIPSERFTDGWYDTDIYLLDKNSGISKYNPYFQLPKKCPYLLEQVIA